MKKYSVHIIWLAVALIALIGGYFYGTMSVASSRTGFAGAGTHGSSMRRLGGANRTAGGGLTAGQITAMDSSSITLQLANGNSQVVFYSSSTPVSEQTTVSSSALKVGIKIMVAGTANSDGSLTAQTIQVRTRGYGGGSSTSTAAGQ